jgi:plastocyanin
MLTRTAVIFAAAVVAAAGTATALLLERPTEKTSPRILVVHMRCTPAPCRFLPDRVVVAAGTRVRWVNEEDVYHTITASDPQHPRRASGQYDHPVAEKGETYDRLFDRPGTYAYFCRPHAETMLGTIEVTG